MSEGWPRHPGVRRVGLTGGIAAGKSEVAAYLTRLGATVVDHDVLARQVIEPGSPGLAAVAADFDGVLAEDGSLDRAALAARVFADPTARARLNAIIHPLVQHAATEAEERAVAAGATVVVHDIPLLVETGGAGHMDEVLVVDAPEELRVRRLVEGRGMTEEHAWSRLAAQADDEERRAVATVVLDGSGPVAALQEQVDRVWGRWAAQRAAAR
jgi:dephospho-CoA kinase